jgi:hypothetical protein
MQGSHLGACGVERQGSTVRAGESWPCCEAKATLAVALQSTESSFARSSTLARLNTLPPLAVRLVRVQACIVHAANTTQVLRDQSSHISPPIKVGRAGVGRAGVGRADKRVRSFSFSESHPRPTCPRIWAEHSRKKVPLACALAIGGARQSWLKPD